MDDNTKKGGRRKIFEGEEKKKKGILLPVTRIDELDEFTEWHPDYREISVVIYDALTEFFKKHKFRDYE